MRFNVARSVGSWRRLCTLGSEDLMSILYRDGPDHAPTSIVIPSVTSADVGYCPYFHPVIELIGRRWTGVVLFALARAPMRFSRLREQVPGLSDRLLTERLAELEREGLVERAEIDGAMQYQLSAVGEGLRPVFNALETFVASAAPLLNCSENPGRRGAG